jgi:quercetin dioxygenase-like cupin family protein
LASRRSRPRARTPESRGEHTGGRFALWEGALPHGAAPPLHSHPQDETLCLIDGKITAWLVEPELALEPSEGPPAWVATRGRRCGPGAVVFAPGGAPHTFRVESDTVRMLVISTPAGIEDMIAGSPSQPDGLGSRRHQTGHA